MKCAAHSGRGRPPKDCPDCSHAAPKPPKAQAPKATSTLRCSEHAGKRGPRPQCAACDALANPAPKRMENRLAKIEARKPDKRRTTVAKAAATTAATATARVSKKCAAHAGRGKPPKDCAACAAAKAAAEGGLSTEKAAANKPSSPSSPRKPYEPKPPKPPKDNTAARQLAIARELHELNLMGMGEVCCNCVRVREKHAPDGKCLEGEGAIYGKSFRSLLTDAASFYNTTNLNLEAVESVS
jgi:hypothetical protein